MVSFQGSFLLILGKLKYKIRRAYLQKLKDKTVRSSVALKVINIKP